VIDPIETAHGNLVERGHCKCCCNKWYSVKKKIPRSTGSRYPRVGPVYDLAFSEKEKDCTCLKDHTEPTE